MAHANCEVVTKVKINTDVKPPARFSVVYHNDNKTTATFVVQSLIDVFGLSYESALSLTSQIDKDGFGVAASGLAKQLASHLCDLVIMKARNEGFPLVVDIKEEE
jgi:ATP-dependent Clp protease adapter protein ClpS